MSINSLANMSPFADSQMMRLGVPPPVAIFACIIQRLSSEHNASIIQSVFREYTVKRRAAVYMQKIWRGWELREFWRECVCDRYCPRNVCRSHFEYEAEEIAEAVAYLRSFS